MKKLLSFFVLLFLMTTHFMAQPPDKMSYQSVIRDANNSLVVNQPVSIRISILQHSASGPTVFMETHTATTNSNGLATIEIGSGQSVFPLTLAQLDWENDDFFIKTEIDATGGQNYIISGIQQLLTVPYAFHSGSASHFDYNHLSNRPTGENKGDLLYWNPQDSTWHIVPAGSEGQVLTMTANGIPQWHTTIFNQNYPPSVITDSIFDVTGYTMLVRATIIDPGTTGIIASGVCWSETNPSPSIGNNNTTDGSGTGSYVSHVAGLKSNTRYYVRAYATNSVGTSYGNILSIITPTHCGTITDYDGNVYNTVYIGRQCWFKENLRTTHYADGNVVTRAPNTSLTRYADIAHTQNPNSCYFFCNHDTTTKEDRGLLYTWHAVMKGAGSSNNNPSGILGVCPYGWHVPSSSEWCELENNLNPGIDITCSNANFRGTMAKMLSKPQYWNSYTNNSFTPGYWHTDSTGFNMTDFSLLPAGYIYESSGSIYTYSSYNSSYDNYYCSVYGSSSNHTHYTYTPSGLTTNAFFWSSTSGCSRQISYNETGIKLSINSTLSNAYNVRCIKDY